jgi:sugar phosphate isomerase/epimerase
LAAGLNDRTGNPMNPDASLSRRQFLGRATLLAAGAGAFQATAPAATPEAFAPPLAVFSKVFQELKLDFEQAAELTAAAGLEGVDCPVRPGGEILPERAAEDLPRYAAALRRRKVDVLLLTTGILGPATPYTHDILRTASTLGLRYYRLHWVQVPKNADASREMDEIKRRLKDLAALNRQLGLTALLQNHSGGGSSRYLGGNLGELYELVKDFEPEQIGVAFDLGHALITHGDGWPAYFERLKRHVKVAYVKDTDRRGKFVPFGDGEFSHTDWFGRLRRMGYRAPMSIHIEFDWARPGEGRTGPALLQALQQSVRTLRGWLARA